MILTKIEERGDFYDPEREERELINYEHELTAEQVSYSLAMLPDIYRSDRAEREAELLAQLMPEEREEFFRKWGR